MHAGLLVFIVFALFVIFWLPCVDYICTYEPVTRAWLAGETRLYDAGSRGFFNAPWLVIALTPLVQLPTQIGQAILNTATLVIALLAARAMTAKPPAMFLALATLHTFDVLLRGQIDGLILGGVTLAWLGMKHKRPRWVGLALPILLIKPTAVILVAVLCLRWAWQNRALVPVVLPSAAVTMLSGLIFGFDWPARYLENMRAVPPLKDLQTTIWLALDEPSKLIAALVAGCAVILWWRLGCTRKAFFVALVTGLLFAPYTLGSHYILLVPVLAALADANLRAGLIGYAVTLTPLLRLRYGYGIAVLDAVYPLALLVLSWLVLNCVKSYNKGYSYYEAL